MRFLLAAFLVVAVACSRQVVVETATPAASNASLKVTNNSTQAISVYATATGTELFLATVQANSTEVIPVPGSISGSTVRLRAALADGSRSYTRDNVTLSGVYEWRVP